MLSILIPIYDYNAKPLVLELATQCDTAGIKYEIIAQDDCSNSVINTENEKINLLENSSFFVNVTNLGRGKNINLLAEKAKNNYLLILDCDTFPTQKNFIKKYLAEITISDCQVVFGGIQYEATKPEKEKLLRWVYGKKREAIAFEKRVKTQNNNALTSNLLIQKTVFESNKFDERIKNYGYEDLLFLSNLSQKGVFVKHIDNPALHLDLETSIIFLEKTKIALENLVLIVDSEISLITESKIISVYKVLKKLRLLEIMVAVFKKSEAKIIANLLSENPSLLLFDFYKLGYFCSVKAN